MGYKIKKTILYVALIVLAITCLLPFLLMIVNATRKGSDILTSFTLLPGSSLQENWKLVSDYFNIFQGFGNSLLIAIPATILTGYFSAMTAFALSKYKFKGSKLLFMVILIFMMIPSQLGLLGFYDLVSYLKLVNSYIPLILPAVAAPGVVFFLKQYTDAILSPALLEAARIDGAGELYIFHRIVVPILIPGIATMSISTFITHWNNYLIPMIILNKKEKFTLPLLIASLKSSTDITANQGATYLAVAISVVPVIVVFCFCSKYIISSITAGGVKE